MEHKHRIELYLSGLADAKTVRKTENALLHDEGFLESFIRAAEQRLHAAPPGFASAVMRLLPNSRAAAPVPVLSGRLCAAVCFCSAAAIMLFTVSGFDRYMLELICEHSGKLGELAFLAENLTLTLGG